MVLGLTLPIVGTTYAPSISHATFVTGAVADLYNIGTTPLDIPFTWGTILCDIGIVTLLIPPGPFQIAIPNDYHLIGASFCMQGGALDAALNIAICDAIDFTIG